MALVPEIVYEDDDLVVVDKPAGLLSATPPGGTEPGLFEILKKRAGPRARGTAQRVWIVHRLDRDASGLLVFAKNERSFHWLKDDLRARRIGRVYLALLEGEISAAGGERAKGSAAWQTVQSFLVDDARGVVRSSTEPPRGRAAADEEAAELAVTHYRVLATGNGHTLVSVRLDSGRRHQIRVHMADLGHPLSGDARYGAVESALGRLALHAAELTIRRPSDGENVTFLSKASAPFYRAVGAALPEATRVALPPAEEPSARRVDTSWDKVAGWYADLMGDDVATAHYDDVIVPGTLRLLEPKPGRRVLDLACGEGSFARLLAGRGVLVTGVDASRKLIAAARKRGGDVRYEVADARDIATAIKGPFDAVVSVMALMNIDPLEPVLRGVASLLAPGGTFTAVILHPAFGAPRQSRWGEEVKDGKRLRFRRVDGYLTSSPIEIVMNPGAHSEGKDAVTTLTFHRPLQAYVYALAQAGFALEALEEWPGPRPHGDSRRSSADTRARLEIPLFLGFRARKIVATP